MLGDPSPLLADNWDPARRDFASLEVGMDPIDAQVVLALGTVRGSGACVLEDGIDELPRKITDAVEVELTSRARRALGRLIRQNDIRLKGVRLSLLSEGEQQAEIIVEYVNLRTGRPSEAEIPIRAPGSS